MARLQILELPEGSGDDRPPFVLIVDQMPKEDAAFEALRCDLGFATAEQLGARAVLVFEETIDIPANGPHHGEASMADAGVLPEELARAAEKELNEYKVRCRVDRECRALLSETLGLSQTQGWDDIRTAVAGLRKSNEARGEAIDRVLGLPYQPQIMDAQHAEPTGYQHGYRIAIQDAKRAVGHQSEHPAEMQAHA